MRYRYIQSIQDEEFEPIIKPSSKSNLLSKSDFHILQNDYDFDSITNMNPNILEFILSNYNTAIKDGVKAKCKWKSSNILVWRYKPTKNTKIRIFRNEYGRKISLGNSTLFNLEYWYDVYDMECICKNRMSLVSDRDIDYASFDITLTLAKIMYRFLNEDIQDTIDIGINDLTRQMVLI